MEYDVTVPVTFNVSLCIEASNKEEAIKEMAEIIKDNENRILELMTGDFSYRLEDAIINESE